MAFVYSVYQETLFSFFFYLKDLALPVDAAAMQAVDEYSSHTDLMARGICPRRV